MNDSTTTLDEDIDLLVDGELPDGQRARFFAAAEEVPGAWRRCALAFIEAQTLQQALGESAQEETKLETKPVGRPWWGIGSMAAALLLVGLLAFTAGRGAPRAGAAAAVVSGVGEAGEEPAGDTMRYDTPRIPVFQPVLAAGGAMGFRTHEPLPAVIVDALRDSGHRVQQTQRVIQLPASDGGQIELPLVETEIIDMRPVAL